MDGSITTVIARDFEKLSAWNYIVVYDQDI
jgi:hypothetical protein